MSGKAAQKLVANIVLGVLHSMSKSMHAMLKPSNKNTRFTTTPVAVAAPIHQPLRSFLQKVTPVFWRSGSTLVYEVTSRASLLRLCLEMFLQRVWPTRGDICSNILVTDHQPVRLHLNTNSCKLKVIFSALATHPNGNLVVAAVQPVLVPMASAPVAED